MTREATAPSPGGDALRPLRPLTERILARLPGRRALWVGVWALVPWANAGGNLLLGAEGTSAVWEQSGTLVALNYAALSFAVLLSLWGTARIADRVGADPTLPNAAFAALDRVRGPLVLTVATAAAFATVALVREGWPAALLRGGTWVVLGVALWTYLWTYGALHLGLDRVGGTRAAADAPAADLALGLRRLGDLAFTGLWILLALLVPVLLTGLPDVVGVVVGLLVLAAGLGVFFLALFRLHRQMTEVKARELAIARNLYAQAYEPVRSTPTLDVLDGQHRLLAAADSLEKRAHALHTWPIDEGTFARVLTITTSVIGITIARLILDPFGL